MERIGDKIRALRESPARKMSQKALAKASGVSQTTIADLERGRNDSSTRLTAIASALGVTAEQLEELSTEELLDISASGTSHQPSILATQLARRLSLSSNSAIAVAGTESGPQLINLSEHPELHQVPRVKFKLSAGVSGFAIEPEEGNGKPIFFRRDWFEFNGYRPDKLFAVRVSGASMEPSLWEGDLVVINTSDTAPKDGEAFAINYEGELCIKRLRRDAGEWWATSDNADQRRFAPKRCTEDVKVIGRVVYKQSERI